MPAMDSGSKTNGDAGNVVFVVFWFMVSSFFCIMLFVAHITNDVYLSIQDLYVPSLAAPLNKTTTLNTSIFIDLKFERMLAFSSPDYTDIMMTLHYGKGRGLLVASHVVEEFSLGRRKEFHVKAAVEAPRLPWEEASRAVSNGSKVVLMVKLVMIQRFIRSCEEHGNGCSWSKGERVVFVAHVAAVDASGRSKAPIEFT